MGGESRRKVMSLLWKLLRTQKVVFRGDVPVQTKAREEIFAAFRRNRHAAEDQIPDMIKEAEEADEFLRTNVIQAEYNPETQNYTQKIRPEHTSEGPIPTGTPLEHK
mmetsp:Transcript_28746/g.40060  ORF Transcript_28746/g.40060 Transcript_28746/m.40060 type:complete len:107 (+) Transcript_28746:24-344(+)